MNNERSIKEKSTKVGNYYVLDYGDYYKVYDKNEKDVTRYFNDNNVIMNNNEFQKAMTRILIESRREDKLKALFFVDKVFEKNKE